MYAKSHVTWSRDTTNASSSSFSASLRPSQPPQPTTTHDTATRPRRRLWPRPSPRPYHDHHRDHPTSNLGHATRLGPKRSYKLRLGPRWVFFCLLRSFIKLTNYLLHLGTNLRVKTAQDRRWRKRAHTTSDTSYGPICEFFFFFFSFFLYLWRRRCHINHVHNHTSTRPRPQPQPSPRRDPMQNPESHTTEEGQGSRTSNGRG